MEHVISSCSFSPSSAIEFLLSPSSSVFGNRERERHTHTHTPIHTQKHTCLDTHKHIQLWTAKDNVAIKESSNACRIQTHPNHWIVCPLIRFSFLQLEKIYSGIISLNLAFTKMDCARSSSRLGRWELFKKGYVNYACAQVPHTIWMQFRFCYLVVL